MLYLATQVLKSIGRLNSAMHNAPVSLNIGSCNTVGASFLYPLLAEFKKLSPDIHISAEISNTQTLTEKILNSSLDLAIVPETVQQDSFEYLPFFDDDIVVICWPGHGRTAALEEIAGEVFVGRENGSATDLLLKNVFAKNGLPLKINCVCNSAASVKLAVKNKMGIAFISRFLVKRELKDHKLGCINLCSKVFTRRFGIIYHKDKVLSKELPGLPVFAGSLGSMAWKACLTIIKQEGLQWKKICRF